jgi:hypothetical protein
MITADINIGSLVTATGHDRFTVIEVDADKGVATVQAPAGERWKYRDGKGISRFKLWALSEVVETP